MIASTIVKSLSTNGVPVDCDAQTDRDARREQTVEGRCRARDSAPHEASERANS
jgi:hypothetical protein